MKAAAFPALHLWAAGATTDAAAHAMLARELQSADIEEILGTHQQLKDTTRNESSVKVGLRALYECVQEIAPMAWPDSYPALGMEKSSSATYASHHSLGNARELEIHVRLGNRI